MKLLLLLLFPFSLAAQNGVERNSGSTKAISFINSLSEQQKGSAMFGFDEMNRYDWHYVPAGMVPRNGIAVKDLDSIQKQALYSFMQVYLSKEGYAKTKNIMELEYLLKELEPKNAMRIPEDYHVAIYGSPNGDSAWGWKFGGHHIALNFTIVKDQLAFAPFFFGANPGEVKQGPKKGTRLLKQEEDLGFKLMNSFSQEQKTKALFQPEAFSEIVTTNAVQVSPLKPVGITLQDLTPEQKTIVNNLVAAYLSSMPPRLAKLRMNRIATEDMNDIHFGWAGELQMGKPHYYRVQGKTFLIEFDNTQNNANHIHTVWRDFDGDFGRDLLREHYHNTKHHN